METQAKRENIFSLIKTILCLLISSFLVAFAAYTLIAPNEFTIGGASGIAILVNAATHGKVPQSIMGFCVNAPLVVVSFFFVKKRFAVLTAAHIGLQTFWLAMIEILFPDFQIRFDDNGGKIFAAIAAGICFGVALALAFKIGGSTGGTDIIAVMIQRKFKASKIAWMVFTINFTIMAASIFVYYDDTQPIAYNLLPIMTSGIALFVGGKVNNSITEGFQSAIEFRIITDKPEEMGNALMHELSRGVTLIPATGMYTKKEHSMLLCVVHRRQVATLQKVMKKVDPESFAVMSNVSQVLGQGFYAPED